MKEEPIGKTCTKCGIEKPLDDFHKSKTGKNGKRSECKVCTAVRGKEYSDAKAEENLKLNIDTSKATKVCVTCNVEKPLNDFHKNKLGKHGRQAECKSCAADRSRKWYEENKDHASASFKSYREANKGKINEYRNKYRRERLKTDPLFRLKNYSRSRISEALRKGGYTKKSKTQEMLGIDWERFQKHLEKTFKEGMSWENHGEWHVDHIMPLASAKDEEELIKLFHYSNTQALWAEENLSKSDKIIEPTQVKLRI